MELIYPKKHLFIARQVKIKSLENKYFLCLTHGKEIVSARVFIDQDNDEIVYHILAKRLIGRLNNEWSVIYMPTNTKGIDILN